jgi:hypothetical protein
VAWKGASRSTWVALKDSPIWTALSRFGTPWPPFDFNSGMWVEDVERQEAEDLGLLKPFEQVKPAEKEFTDNLQNDLAGVSSENRQNLESLFGPQINIDGDTVEWKGNADDYEADAHDRREVARSVFARSEEAFGGLGFPELSAGRGHEAATTWTRNANAVELSAVASGRKPIFHEDLSLHSDSELRRLASNIQARCPNGVVVFAETGHLYGFNHDLVSRLTHPNLPARQQVISNRDNGTYLGYGGNIHDRTHGPFVTVWIVDPTGSRVAGFRTPSATAPLYAAARLRDWLIARGPGFSARILPEGGAA